MTDTTGTLDDDRTLDAKVRHLIGIVGYRFGLEHTLDKNIAQYLGIQRATWARKKSGKLSVDEADLSRLARYFRLDADQGLTYEVFLLPTLGAFRQALVDGRVGAHGGDDLDHVRTVLMRAANFRTNGIAIEKIGRRAGGLGGGPAQERRRTILRPGDSARVRIAHPPNGHLLVLNDCPDGEMICLMPSRQFAQSTATPGELAWLPAAGAAEPAFEVGAQFGRFRLFAVWTSDPLALPLVERAAATPEPGIATPGELRELAQEVRKRDAREPDARRYEIRCADYHVEA